MLRHLEAPAWLHHCKHACGGSGRDSAGIRCVRRYRHVVNADCWPGLYLLKPCVRLCGSHTRAPG